MNTQAEQANRYAAPNAEVDDVGDDAHELAGRGTRLVAVILDGLILCLLVYVPMMISLGLSGIMTAAKSVDPNNPMAGYAMMGRMFAGVTGIVVLVGLIIFAALNIYFVKKNGQSVGKKLMGIKVVRTDGSPISLGRIFWLRNVVNALPSAIPFIGGLYGLIDALLIFGEPRRCIHDRIADTIVVKA